jgi:hypothetical protein
MFSLFQSEPAAPASGSKAIVRCEDDYERATQRIAELGMPSPGSQEEAELIGLVEAVEKWDARHDDATGWE